MKILTRIFGVHLGAFVSGVVVGLMKVLRGHQKFWLIFSSRSPEGNFIIRMGMEIENLHSKKENVDQWLFLICFIFILLYIFYI